ncbi:MAG: DoxX family membrane protein [Candidatus Paceibacterota bacterium]
MDTKLKQIAPILLRITMSLIVLWFGYAQVTNPSTWLGFLPSWTKSLPITQLDLIYFNGVFEIVFGIFLLMGFYTRFVALALALHLFDIAYTVGYGALGVRDIGLAVSTLVVCFNGIDSACLDKIFVNKV